MKLGIIIQARTGSTRLPNKILLPFYEKKCVLEILIENLAKNIDIPIIVATSNNSSDDEIEQLCKKNSISCYRGEEENVLKRFYDCAIKFNLESVIRICSDNPFIDIEKLLTLIYYNSNSDYISYKINDVPSIRTHFGFWCERIKTVALKKVIDNTESKLYLEHVTNYIYENPKYFSLNWINIEFSKNHLFPTRLTLDTIEDFEILKLIYSELKSMDKKININNVMNFISDRSDLQQKMQNQIQLNSK